MLKTLADGVDPDEAGRDGNSAIEQADDVLRHDEAADIESDQSSDNPEVVMF